MSQSLTNVSSSFTAILKTVTLNYFSFLLINAIVVVGSTSIANGDNKNGIITNTPVTTTNAITSSSLPVVIEVDQGEDAILSCPSNDDNHRFQFWLLNTNNVIKPGNDVNRHKYKYEVLTGTLWIKAASQNEHGVYTCFCRDITSQTYYIRSVQLIVKQNWEVVYESDASANALRIAILFAAVAILMLILIVLYYLHKGGREAFLRDLTREDSPDDVDNNRPTTSFYRMTSSTATIIETQEIDGLDNPTLDTDLPNAEQLPKQFQTSVLVSSGRP